MKAVLLIFHVDCWILTNFVTHDVKRQVFGNVHRDLYVKMILSVFIFLFIYSCLPLILKKKYIIENQCVEKIAISIMSIFRMNYSLFQTIHWYQWIIMLYGICWLSDLKNIETHYTTCLYHVCKTVSILLETVLLHCWVWPSGIGDFLCGSICMKFHMLYSPHINIVPSSLSKS